MPVFCQRRLRKSMFLLSDKHVTYGLVEANIVFIIKICLKSLFNYIIVIVLLGK